MKPNRFFPVIAAFFAFLSPIASQGGSHAPARRLAEASLPAVDFDRLEENIVFFKAPAGATAPKSLKTELYDLKYLGVIRSSNDQATASPYFLFIARPCKNCLQDTGIYAIRPTGGKPTAFVYPGKVYEPKSRALVLESRAFFGHCLSRQSGDQYIVFQKERVDRRKQLQSSVLIAEPGSDHMNERLIERHLPRLQDTVRLVKSKSCHEIDGRNRLMLTRPLDINARHSSDADDDDDDDAKESQADESPAGK
jgi:hypothetical protein